MTKPISEPIRKRRKLCLELAEIADQHVGTSRLDVDDLAKDFEIHLPLTYDESQAEADEMEEEESKQKDWRDNDDSLLSRLCRALDLNRKEFSLKAIIEAAIERAEKHKAAIAACHKAYHHLDTYGVVQGHEMEMVSQKACFDALRKFVYPEKK